MYSNLNFHGVSTVTLTERKGRNLLRVYVDDRKVAVFRFYAPVKVVDGEWDERDLDTSKKPLGLDAPVLNAVGGHNIDRMELTCDIGGEWLDLTAVDANENRMDIATLFIDGSTELLRYAEAKRCECCGQKLNA